MQSTRPFDPSETANAIGHIFTRRAFSILLLSFVPTLLGLLSAIVGEFIYALPWPEGSIPESMFPLVFALVVVGGVAAFLVYLAVMAFAHGALIAIVVGEVTGRPLSLSLGLRLVSRRIVFFVLTETLYTVACLIGGIACFAPGLLALIAFAFAPHACLLADANPVQAFWRSIEMYRDAFTELAISMVVVTVLCAGVYIASMFADSAIHVGLGIAFAPLPIVARVSSSVLWSMTWTLLTAVFYVTSSVLYGRHQLQAGQAEPRPAS